MNTTADTYSYYPRKYGDGYYTSKSNYTYANPIEVG